MVSEYGFGCFILNTDALSKMSSQYWTHGCWAELQQMITYHPTVRIMVSGHTYSGKVKMRAAM